MTILTTVLPTSVALVFVVSAAFLSFTNKPIYAQDNNPAQSQRLGTTNILSFPDVNILYSNGKAVPLDQEFLIAGSNNTGVGMQARVAIKNPDYGLNDTIPMLSVGQNFRINSTTDQDTPLYSRVNVALVPIASLPPATNPSNVDPEDDLIQKTPLISLGSYVGNIGNLVIPQVTRPGFYLLDVYLHYPSYDMTAVYNTLLRIVNNNVPS